MQSTLKNLNILFSTKKEVLKLKDFQVQLENRISKIKKRTRKL